MKDELHVLVILPIFIDLWQKDTYNTSKWSNHRDIVMLTLEALLEKRAEVLWVASNNWYANLAIIIPDDPELSPHTFIGEYRGAQEGLAAHTGVLQQYLQRTFDDVGLGVTTVAAREALIERLPAGVLRSAVEFDLAHCVYLNLLRSETPFAEYYPCKQAEYFHDDDMDEDDTEGCVDGANYSFGGNDVDHDSLDEGTGSGGSSGSQEYRGRTSSNDREYSKIATIVNEASLYANESMVQELWEGKNIAAQPNGFAFSSDIFQVNETVGAGELLYGSQIIPEAYLSYSLHGLYEGCQVAEM